MHVIAAKAIAFGEALQPAFQRLRRPDRSPTPGRWPTSCMRARLPPRLRRHRQPPAAGGRHVARPDRQAGGEGARRGRHHGQPQRHPVRHAAAAGPVGHPHRHAGADDARHARDGDAADRRRGSARCWRPRTTRRSSTACGRPCWNWASTTRAGGRAVKRLRARRRSAAAGGADRGVSPGVGRVPRRQRQPAAAGRHVRRGGDPRRRDDRARRAGRA